MKQVGSSPPPGHSPRQSPEVGGTKIVLFSALPRQPAAVYQSKRFSALLFVVCLFVLDLSFYKDSNCIGQPAS